MVFAVKLLCMQYLRNKWLFPNFKKKLILSIKQITFIHKYTVISDHISDEHVCVEIRSRLKYYTLIFPVLTKVCVPLDEKKAT